MISIGLLLILCCSGVYSSQNEIFDLNNEVLQKFLSNYEENLMESNIGEGKNLICQRDLALFLKKLTTELWAIQSKDT